MMVRKFYAESVREAMRLVRDKLGTNALILSNRKTAAGVEILAVPEGEFASVTADISGHASPSSRAPEKKPEQPVAAVHTVSVQAQQQVQPQRAEPAYQQVRPQQQVPPQQHVPPMDAAGYDLVQDLLAGKHELLRQGMV